MKTFNNTGNPDSYDIVHMKGDKDKYTITENLGKLTYTSTELDRTYIVDNIEEMGFKYSNGVSTRFKWNDEFAPFNVKASCKAWLEAGNNTDGVYTINFGEGDTQVYCDMTTDGGGWTLLLNQKNGYWFTEANNLSLNTSTPSPDTNLYSILDKVDLITNNEYMYKNYDSSSTYKYSIVTQTASVIANNGSTTASSPAGWSIVSTTDISTKYLNGFGLVQHSYATAKYGSHTDSWWWSLGQFKKYTDSCPLVTNPDNCSSFQYNFWTR